MKTIQFQRNQRYNLYTLADFQRYNSSLTHFWQIQRPDFFKKIKNKKGIKACNWDGSTGRNDFRVLPSSSTPRTEEFPSTRHLDRKESFRRSLPTGRNRNSGLLPHRLPRFSLEIICREKSRKIILYNMQVVRTRVKRGPELWFIGISKILRH